MTQLRSAVRLATIGAAAAFLVAAPAMAQTEDHAPTALKSSTKMTQDKAGSESWTYAQPRDVFTKYRTLIVDQTAVYNGPDAQFDGDISAADRAQFASVITDALRSELAKSFPTPARAQADTLRLKVTLLGAEKTKGGLATATRVTPIGFGLSAVKSALGKGGSLTGSVLVAVELYDARTNELLLAAVRRRHPDALDVPATLGTEETVKAVAREFADTARERLEDLTGVSGR